MKSNTEVAILCFLVMGFAGCTMFQIIQPLRLYDLKDGTTIEVLFHPPSRDHGLISSRKSPDESFRGEYDFSSERASGWAPSYGAGMLGKTNAKDQPPIDDFAEAYGFARNSQARPVGTGIIVGKDGTVIELVFFRISPDLQTGDGIGRDNKGRYFRIFLSTETY